MSLLAKIQADANAALKAGDKDRLRVLRMLASEIKKAAIDSGKEPLPEEDAVAVLFRAAKTRADSVDQYAKAGRADLADRERAEIAVVEGYLPAAPTESAIREVAKAVAAEKGALVPPIAGPKAMGLVMKETLARLGGAADGKAVARIVSEVLRG